MVKIRNLEKTSMTKGQFRDKKYRVTKVIGEIQNSKNQDEWNKYENIEISWIKINQETGEEAYELIKDEHGKTHKISAEKTATIPAGIIGSVFKVKKES